VMKTGGNDVYRSTFEVPRAARKAGNRGRGATATISESSPIRVRRGVSPMGDPTNVILTAVL